MENRQKARKILFDTIAAEQPRGKRKRRWPDAEGVDAGNVLGIKS